MHEIKISQLGEGLTQVKIVALLKSAGDLVGKDEPLLEIETDKAVMEIESPHAGRLARWLVEAGQIVAVGSRVAVVDESENVVVDESRETVVDESENAVVTEMGVAPPRSLVRNHTMSPREKARMNAEETAAQSETLSSTKAWPLSPRQNRLNRLMRESRDFVDEAWLSMPVWWDDLSAAARRFRGLEGLDYRPTVLEILAWSAAQAQKSHPKFGILNAGARGYAFVDEPFLGVSVALPNDELATANVSSAIDDFADFVRALRESVGAVQRDEIAPGRCSLVISYLATQGVQFAAPRLVMPSVATLFVGAPFDVPAKVASGELEWRRQAHLVLTFDHRVINGAGAAAFLKSVIARAGNLAPNEV